MMQGEGILTVSNENQGKKGKKLKFEMKKGKGSRKAKWRRGKQ